jgi:hypothetical protein
MRRPVGHLLTPLATNSRTSSCINSSINCKPAWRINSPTPFRNQLPFFLFFLVAECAI